VKVKTQNGSVNLIFLGKPIQSSNDFIQFIRICVKFSNSFCAIRKTILEDFILHKKFPGSILMQMPEFICQFFAFVAIDLIKLFLAHIKAIFQEFPDPLFNLFPGQGGFHKITLYRVPPGDLNAVFIKPDRHFFFINVKPFATGAVFCLQESHIVFCRQLLFVLGDNA
jgi:hypothetical protein